MLKQGFQQDIQQIFKAVMKDNKKKPQVILFSATIPEWLNSISKQYQEKNCTVIDLVGSMTVTIPKTIKHLFVTLKNNHDMCKIINSLCKKYLPSSSSRCFIFCETKRQVNSLYE